MGISTSCVDGARRYINGSFLRKASPSRCDSIHLLNGVCKLINLLILLKPGSQPDKQTVLYGDLGSQFACVFSRA